MSSLSVKGHTLHAVPEVGRACAENIFSFRVSAYAVTKAGKKMATFLVASPQVKKNTLTSFYFSKVEDAVRAYVDVSSASLYTSHLRTYRGDHATPFKVQRKGSRGHIEVSLYTLDKNGERKDRFLIWKSDTFSRFSDEKEAKDIAKKNALRAVFETEVETISGPKRTVIACFKR
jgi:hypothetical protein